MLFPEDLYQRQSYLNRTQVLLANKVETLSIPIQGRRPKIPMNQVKIDYSQKWQAVHLRGIKSAYGKAPFFEYFFPFFQQVIENGEESLWELNLKLLTICLNLLRWPVKVSQIKKKDISPDILDIRSQIRPGTAFFDRSFYRPYPYTQLFGANFESNLSIIDLLFCEGKNSGIILEQSIKKDEQSVN